MKGDRDEAGKLCVLAEIVWWLRASSLQQVVTPAVRQLGMIDCFVSREEAAFGL